MTAKRIDGNMSKYIQKCSTMKIVLLNLLFWTSCIATYHGMLARKIASSYEGLTTFDNHDSRAYHTSD